MFIYVRIIEKKKKKELGKNILWISYEKIKDEFSCLKPAVYTGDISLI